jgi:small redox-active disulfide protein 2
MLSIKVLGPGCKNCDRLETHAVEAAEIFGRDRPELEVTVEKITDTERFLDYGLLKTPGLVVNEQLVSSGRIPSPEQIVAWLQSAGV